MKKTLVFVDDCEDILNALIDAVKNSIGEDKVNYRSYVNGLELILDINTNILPVESILMIVSDYKMPLIMVDELALEVRRLDYSGSFTFFTSNPKELEISLGKLESFRIIGKLEVAAFQKIIAIVSEKIDENV